MSANRQAIDAICAAAAKLEAAQSLAAEEEAAQDAAGLLPKIIETAFMVRWSATLRFLLTEEDPPQAEALQPDGSWLPIQLTDGQKRGLARYFDEAADDDPRMPERKYAI